MAECPPIDIADLLRRAFAAYRERALPQAEALFAEVLGAKPDQYEALLATGVISLQRGQDARALELIRGALAINPDAAEAHFHLGVGLDNRFRRNIEAAYRRMWEMHVRGESPHAFGVNADEIG